MLYNPSAPRAELDLSLFWSVVLLLAIGLVMVYSASIAMAEAEKISGYRAHYFLVRHAIYLALGIVAGMVAFQIPMAMWQRIAPWLFITAVFCWCWCSFRASDAKSTVAGVGFRWAS